MPLALVRWDRLVVGDGLGEGCGGPLTQCRCSVDSRGLQRRCGSKRRRRKRELELERRKENEEERRRLLAYFVNMVR